MFFFFFQDEVRGLRRRVKSAYNSVVAQMPSIANEDDFSSRLAQSIESRLNGRFVGNAEISVAVRKLNDRGRGCDEGLIGADMIVVFTMQYLPLGFEMKKASLIQAKIHRGNRDMRAFFGDRNIERQINLMHSHTKNSYVVGYFEDGVSFTEAETFQAFKNSKAKLPPPSRPFEYFFSESAECKVGSFELGKLGDELLLEKGRDLSALLMLDFTATKHEGLTREMLNAQ